MSSHFDRNFAAPQESSRNDGTGKAPDANAIDGAAEALREVELESAQPASPTASAADDDFAGMSIDELREIAASLHVANRAQVVSKDELIAVIRGCDPLPSN